MMGSSEISVQERIFWQAMKRALLAMVHAIDIRLGKASGGQEGEAKPGVDLL